WRHSLPISIDSLSHPSSSTCSFYPKYYVHPRALHSFPTRRSSDLIGNRLAQCLDIGDRAVDQTRAGLGLAEYVLGGPCGLLRIRSEEHTSELQSRENLVCRLLLEKKKN